MKKISVMMTALMLALAMGTAAMAEGNGFAFRNGITFGMSMKQVIAGETVRYHEIDNEYTRGGITFAVIEYENVPENNVRADLKYLFAGDELAAIRVNYETRDISYEQVKADLAAKYGKAGSVNLAVLANGIYAVDEDGELEGRAEAIVSGSLMIVIEQDEDDIDVTFVNLAAAYVSAS